MKNRKSSNHINQNIIFLENNSIFKFEIFAIDFSSVSFINKTKKHDFPWKEKQTKIQTVLIFFAYTYTGIYPKQIAIKLELFSACTVTIICTSKPDKSNILLVRINTI